MKNAGNRWLIAIMGIILQVVLGTVYAWSFFQKPIMIAYGWNNVQVMWIFSIAICFLGIGATIGGLNLAKFGPGKLATAGIVGPQIAAFIKDNYADNSATYTFITGPIMLVIGVAIAFTLNNKSLADEKA